ncbi:unnamed protein product [Closterium sp. Yama58-4]|nr:unnamed protein product [Closterium sp. Yama58-4]
MALREEMEKARRAGVAHAMHARRLGADGCADVAIARTGRMTVRTGNARTGLAGETCCDTEGKKKLLDGWRMNSTQPGERSSEDSVSPTLPPNLGLATMAAVRCRSAVSRGVCASASLFDSQLSQRIASILCSSSDLPLSVSSPHSEPLRVTGPAAGLSRFHSSSFIGADPNAGSTPSSPAVAGDVAQSPLLPRLRSWFAAPDLTPPPFAGPAGGSEAGSGADGEARGDAQGRGEARMYGGGARGDGDQRVYGRDPRGYGRNFRPRPPVARPKLDLLEKYMHPSLMSAEERRQEELRGVRERFRVHEGDTGSSEVQIALLTSRIAYMANHLQTHKKDLHSRRGLDGMLARRRKLLKYLRRKNWDSYCHVIAELGLRDRVDLQS